VYCEDQRCFAFSRAKGLSAKDIYKELFVVYCVKCLSRKPVHNGVVKISQGFSKSAANARPGRSAEIATVGTERRVEDFIRSDRKIAIDSVATALACSHGLVYSIMHDPLKFRKVCARCVH
jgi:hypothetical protein